MTRMLGMTWGFIPQKKKVNIPTADVHVLKYEEIKKNKNGVSSDGVFVGCVDLILSKNHSSQKQIVC